MGIIRILAEQLRQPRGVLGKLAGHLMARMDKPSNDWAISLMNIQPNDHLLEIGFGPGMAIKQASEIASNGFVAGIDFSEPMLEQARKLNASAIEAGLVELKYGEASSIPYGDELFDKVFGINVMYVLPDLSKAIKEMSRVLKPRGLITFCMPEKEFVEKRRRLALEDIFVLHDIDEVLQFLAEAGFCGASYEKAKVGPGTWVCVLAEKNPGVQSS
jgi:ubiquinone/menaquinone biosynthesis C-methylase UbiE